MSPRPPFSQTSSSVTVVSSTTARLCTLSTCTRSRPGAASALLPAAAAHSHAHAHHAVRMYLPGAAHPHCTCTRLEVLTKALVEARKAVQGRSLKKGHSSHHHHAVNAAAAHFLAGALGGASATYSTHWLDTIKVRMQTFPSLYPNCRQCAKMTLKEGGVRALYQGAVPAVVGHAIKASAVFMSYGFCQEAIWRLSRALGVPALDPGDTESHHHMRMWQLASAGAMTGVLASFVLCPIELLKCRMQALSAVQGAGAGAQASLPAAAKEGSLGMARSIVQTDGVRGLYRGLTGMWAKEIPGSFVYFGSYECAKKVVMQHSHGASHVSKPAVFMCGVFAGLCFCVTHPIESIKTRVQVTSQSGRQGFLKATAHILKTEGLKPLCSGLKTNMVRACLYSGVQFVTYEVVRDYLMEVMSHDPHKSHDT